ncbi:MAG TPA: FAD-dependent oxidoreductase [Alphaproteobacteria bacterium]|nr:FAD-dependent oxidoreductase [Alphaproteobacteria bacterium]
MKSHAQVVVIGGGVVGCSVLYHLTKAGWKDVVLIERDELTSGSTWHAAGGMHTINLDPNVAKLQQYTINLYKEIEEISGQSCGVHITGGIMLAGTNERLDWLKQAHARGRYLGMETEFVSLDEAARRFPIMEKKYFVGALYDPIEGHVDPSGVTHAYAKAARVQGAEIYRFTRVTGLEHRPDGTWNVRTEKGEIHAEHVVNAGGLWAREIGRMVGLEVPVLAMEHQYLLTEDIPEVKALKTELLHAIDFEGEIYIRQEGNGILMGTYERAGVPWSTFDTPWDFTHELLAPDLERIAPSLEVGFKHYPAIERAGIKKVINGPFTFAPDGNPVIGPVRGLRNYWLACGVMAGFSQGGGVGLTLANWMIDGDPGMDIWGMDVARFGDWATLAYTNAKVRENYSRRFRIRFPNEELPAGRPLRTTPIYDRLSEKRAVFGVSFGLEHALWFAPDGVASEESVTFRRSNAHGPVGEECHAVRDGVGLMEISAYAKYLATGPAVESWLSHLLVNHMPRLGRMALAPMLNPDGKLIGDFTVAKERAERFYIFGSGIAEEYHMRWFEAHLPEKGVAIKSLRTELVGLAIAGPKSRLLLERLTRTDVSNEGFPFLSFRAVDLGMIPTLVGRISFTGDLGYEIWVSADYQRALHDAIVAAGADLGLRHFGARALNSLRLEKSFGSWAREFRPIYGPAEAGLGRFVDLRKNDFIGRDAALREKEVGPKRRIATFVVDENGADALGDEPVWHDGKAVGWVTSGGYAHHVGKSVALGYIPAELAGAEGGFALEILGERRPARIAREPLFDPQGKRMRG